MNDLLNNGDLPYWNLYLSGTLFEMGNTENVKLTQFSRIKWERAKGLRKKGQYRESENELKEALDEQPASFLLKTSLAQLYLRQDKLTEARILAESVLFIDPQYPEALFIMGEIAFKKNRLDDALRCFRHASQKDPKPYLILRVVKTLREMKRFQDALETLDSYQLGEKKDFRLLKEKAVLWGRMRQWDKALSIYEELHELDPDDRFVRKEIYRLKGKKRPDRKVIDELEKMIHLPSRKNDPQLHALLGQKLKEAGKLKEAAAEFRTAYRLDPDDPFFLKQEGFCHYQLKDYKQAIETLSEAFRKNPGDYIVKSTLNKLYTITQNRAGFLLLLEEILEKNPHNIKLIGTLRKLKKQIHETESGNK